MRNAKRRSRALMALALAMAGIALVVINGEIRVAEASSGPTESPGAQGWSNQRDATPQYSVGGTPADPVFSNGFDDVQAILADVGILAVGEAGSATFGVWLALEPPGTVAVSVASGDPGAATVVPALLNFTSTNYSVHQTITASGVSDLDSANEAVTITLSSTGIGDRFVTANVSDDDIPTKETIEVGAGPFPLPSDDPAVQVDGVGRNAGGDLVRDTTALANRFLWIPNDREGTVSKVDPVSGAELARYASVTHDATRVVNHVSRSFPAWNADANGNTYADNRPQYTAVDFAGDAWVANPALDFAGLQSTVTKLRGRIATCIDLNSNGVADTSREMNGTPGIQIADPAEYFGEGDECIAMTVVVGDAGVSAGGIRALAIDAGRGGVGSNSGNPWVGTWSEQAFYQLHGVTGAILQRVATPGVRAFTATIDSLGRLWARDHCCGTVNLGRIDTLQNPAPFVLITNSPPFQGLSRGNYSLTVDLANRVWVAGYPHGGLMRYDPTLNGWVEAAIAGYRNNGQARGAAIDGRGNIWTSFHPNGTDGLVARFDPETAVATGAWQMDDSSGGLANIPVGVGVDFAGNVWTSNQITSNISRLHLDPVTGEPTPHPVTGDFVDVFPVGPNPYVHSDFTGLNYRRVTRPDGDYRVSIPPCLGNRVAHWLSAGWDASTPAGTRAELWLRASNDSATLAEAPLQGPWTASPANLQSLPGPVGDSLALQFTLRLVSESPVASPTVHAYRITRVCPPP